MSGHFDEIYAAVEAPSVPPETLLTGKVLQALYTVHSDRQLCARMQTDLMFRWFVDLPLDESVLILRRTVRTRRGCCSMRGPICFFRKWWSWGTAHPFLGDTETPWASDARSRCTARAS